MSVAEKNPVFVDAGKRGALKRWGEPRVVKIADLSPETRRLVIALVEAAKKAAPNANGTALEEDRVTARSTTASRS